MAPHVATTRTAADACPSSACERCKGRSPVCFRCKGVSWQICRRCDGKGELTREAECRCAGSGARARAGCRRCGGMGTFTLAKPCHTCAGEGMWECMHCQGRGFFSCGACGSGRMVVRPVRFPRAVGDAPSPPEFGATLRRCGGTEQDQIAKLWAERGGCVPVRAVWSIDNPYLSWRYRERRAELAWELGRPPAELRGFHGTHPRNILAIAERGFDDSRRYGQAYGPGEYFAKNPQVSMNYAKGGSFMFVCQLCLGRESASMEKADGDHIWVPDCSYYVISRPTQALPTYVVEFESPYTTLWSDEAAEPELRAALASAALFLGAAGDSRVIDFCVAEPELRLAAQPAAWWNGDLSAFNGELRFDACDALGTGAMSAALVQDKVVLVRRCGGDFAAKADVARKAGARALLVVQNSAAAPIAMTGAVSVDGSFPAAMISQTIGERLIKFCLSGACPRLVDARRRRPEAALPANRPCAMSAASTDALWLGYLHAHFADQQLAGDVRRFLEAHAPSAQDAAVRVVRGKYTQAKIKLTTQLSRAEVLALNGKPFVECGATRTVTVDDAHGSKGQQCPRSIAGYCRGRNLRFVDPCWCDHRDLPTTGAKYHFDHIDLGSAKGDEICSAFMQSAPFHNGTPRVTAVRAIHNPRLAKQHELFRAYLAEKNGEAPRQVELYHGTNVNILDTVYTHGLFPPSDMQASEACPMSGGKGLRTSLCDNTCEHCRERHEWDRCHMFGLGVYLGDIAQKSHRYVSGTSGSGAGYKMVLCSVLLGDALKLEGHLTQGQGMHDVFSLRALDRDGFDGMVDSVCQECDARPIDQKDILFVKGLQGGCRPGYSVFNSEYISFHPYQCLPLYEISYTL